MNELYRRGPVARFFVGLWDAMNFTRRLVFNLLFLLLLVLFIVLLNAGERVQPLLGDTTLVISPEGALVEQYSQDPVGRAISRSMGDGGGEVQLRDLLRALDHAATDKRINRVVLRLDQMQGGGMASRREFAAAIARVRAAGKQVVAFGETMNQEQYLVAAQADEVYLDPMGYLLLEGLGRRRLYFREALEDKLGVDVHLFKVGEYKSAAEPYVLDAASPASKQADLYWMNDLWQRYLGDVGAARKLDPAAIGASIENLPTGIAAMQGDVAKFALQQKLVDGLKTREEVDVLLTDRGVVDDDAEGGFRQIGLDGYLAHADRGLKSIGSLPHLAVVVAEGEISGGEKPPGTIGGISTAALLREARDDDNVKAVVLRVDSPGGEVFPSEQIRREVVALKEAGKPVVVSMGDLAASGGYWISMNADRIYADPSTITGSIGIYGLFPTIPRALDKIGVNSDGVGTTRFAGAFDITQPLDPAVGEVIQSVIDKGYRDFIGRVAEARDQPVAQIDTIARGRVWTGAQAMERGLVDELGGLQSALDNAAQRAKLGEAGEYQVRYIERSLTPFAQLMEGFAQSRIGAMWLGGSGFGQDWLARSLMAQSMPSVAQDLRFLRSAITPVRGVPVRSIAYCFCSL